MISRAQGFGKTGSHDARVKGASGGAAGKGSSKKSGFATRGNASAMATRSWEKRRERLREFAAQHPEIDIASIGNIKDVEKFVREFKENS